MAWPADVTDGTVLTAAALNGIIAAIKTWGGTVNNGGYALVVAHAAPTDADIPAGGVVMWVDETAHALKFRARYSDGTTLKSGSVSLA